MSETSSANVTPIEPNKPEGAATKRAVAGRTVRKKRSPWPLRVGLLLFVAAAAVIVPRALKKKPIQADVVKVERTTVVDEISSSSAGEVLAERSASIRAELGGRVVSVRHKVGDRVKLGEVIVGLDAADLVARLRQAEATFAAQRAMATQAALHADSLKKAAERAQRLADKGAETTRAAEDASAQTLEAQAARSSAEAQLEQAQASLQVAGVARAKASLTAPFDGMLTAVPINTGEAMQIGAVAFEIIDDSRLHVEATIEEADIGHVKLGQSATLRLDALRDRPIKGVVSRLDPTVRKDQKGARTLRLEVEVSDLKEALAAGIRPGMSANVDIRVAEKPNVLSLPTNLIVGRGTKRSVYLVKDGVVVDQAIGIGLSSWERTEIVNGLSEGDLVVANLNVIGLAPGVAIAAPTAAERAP